MSDDVFANDQGESVLDTLVGDGKKFESVEALAQGKAKSDEHIKTVEQENAELKEQLEKAGANANVQELIDAVKEAKAQKGDSEGAKTMSTEELQEVIRQVVEGDKSADTKASNRAKGNELVLKKTDGNVEAARTLVAERAASLGMTAKSLAELSEESPQAFAALIDTNSDGAGTGSPLDLPNVNTDVLNQNLPQMELDGFKTKAWFDDQRKTVGRVKFINDPNIQRELSRSMNGLGERFNN